MAVVAVVAGADEVFVVVAEAMLVDALVVLEIGDTLDVVVETELGLLEVLPVAALHPACIAASASAVLVVTGLQPGSLGSQPLTTSRVARSGESPVFLHALMSAPVLRMFWKWTQVFGSPEEPPPSVATHLSSLQLTS